MSNRTKAVVALTLCAAGALGVATAAPQQSPTAQSEADWRRMRGMGLQHKAAWDLYTALKKAANGGRISPPFSQLPDWSGLWRVAGGGTLFGCGPGGETPKLTPAAATTLKVAAERGAQGIEYDENLSQCGPPGFPRWLVIPFLREFIVRPEQTWLWQRAVGVVQYACSWSRLAVA